MKNPDRYERAKKVLRERSKEGQRRAAALAIQAQAEAERKAAERQQQATALSRYAKTILDRLDQSDDQGGYSEVEFVKVRKKGLFGRYYDTDEVGFNLVDAEYTYKIQGDDQVGIAKYYLLLDGTFVKWSSHINGRKGMSGPWVPFPATAVPPENIVDDPDVYGAMLRSLEGLGGPPETT